MIKKSPALQTILVFAITLFISLMNANFTSFGFADAGEFSLVSFYAGIAHAPGFPAYVFCSYCWSTLTAITGLSHLASMVIFSAICVALAAGLLSIMSRKITEKLFPELHNHSHFIIAIITGLTPICGSTIWHWSHSIEVYGFQILATAILFYGLVLHEIDERKSGHFIAAIGLALGLANHHLTMLLFTPFLALLLPKGWLQVIQETKKKKQVERPSFYSYFRGKEFLMFAGITATITLVFYVGMMIRAGSISYFAFGSPDNFKRLIYHISGGAWIKNTQQTVNGIVAMRFPYFMRISFEQIFLFIPFLILGITGLFARKLRRLPLAIIGYFLIVLIYQLRIDQTADTDAYMVMPFFMLAILLPVGMAKAVQWDVRMQNIFPIFLVIGAWLNAPKTDLRHYDVSESLMKALDDSAPKGSVVLIADWTTIITYNYYRHNLNFRPDLIVLNYDLKFTHFKLLPNNYPQLYKSIQKEYDHFIELLGTAHPLEIYNTGCTLDNPELLASYTDVIKAILAYCTSNHVAFMADPKAYLTLNQYQVFPSTFISGCLVSSIPTQQGKTFPALPFNWLNSPRLLMEPAAADKLVDLEAALDFSRTYYRQTGDLKLFNQSEASYQRIKKLQRQMKKRMEFLFRPA